MSHFWLTPQYFPKAKWFNIWRQNGHHFTDDIFKYNFLNEGVWISVKISLKFVPNSECMYSSLGSDNGMAPVRLQAVIWTNDGYLIDAYLCHSASMS